MYEVGTIIPWFTCEETEALRLTYGFPVRKWPDSVEHCPNCHTTLTPSCPASTRWNLFRTQAPWRQSLGVCGGKDNWSHPGECRMSSHSFSGSQLCWENEWTWHCKHFCDVLPQLQRIGFWETGLSCPAWF